MYSLGAKTNSMGEQMSIPIHEKIERIRTSEGLSQPEFAELIGLSINTYKGIVKRGSSPRFEVVEQIAARWPQYAYWLLTSDVIAPSHISPMQNEQSVIRIFERLNNPEPVVTELMTKSEWLTGLTFLQSIDNPNDLYAMLETKASIPSQVKQCILITGNINFCSDDKGKVGLTRLASFLEEAGRSDLIKSSEMKHVFASDIERLFISSEILEEKLITPDIGGVKWKMYTHLNFVKWRMEGNGYTPTYTWVDMEI